MSSLKKVETNNKSKYIGKMKCPECNSMNTRANNKTAVTGIIGIIVCSIGSFISLLIPFIGWIATPIFILGAVASVIMLVLSAFTKTYTLVCLDCNAKYTIDKKEYNETIKHS